MFGLIPEQASTIAARVDGLYWFINLICVVMLGGIVATILYCLVRYRRHHDQELGASMPGNFKIELLWTIGPFAVMLVMFVLSTNIYFDIFRPAPTGAMEIHVVGKQWMWKFQHMGGQREINELHIPRGVPIKLTLSTQDVIHSLFIPAFRVKTDVVPGSYRQLWFQATKPGQYHLFCAEYCGTMHSGMIGKVVVMDPAEYQTWLTGGPALSPAVAGQKLFQDLACDTCHRQDRQGQGPMLVGLFGMPVQLQNGESVIADENYLRESILNPQAKIVAGFQPLMPTFQGLVNEEQLLQLITYIRSLGPQQTGAVQQPGSDSLEQSQILEQAQQAPEQEQPTTTPDGSSSTLGTAEPVPDTPSPLRTQ